MPTSPLPSRPRAGHPRLARALLVAAALLLGLWGAWRSFAPQPANAREQLQAQARRIATLEQRNATLALADRISREANARLQATLAERDEEIAALRADVAFYERFAGSAQRRGLGVHALVLQPQRDPQLWHFTATLTQNISRGVVNAGRLQLQVEASDGRRLRRLEWPALAAPTAAAGIPYAFKYFQQVEGDLVLPRGSKPVRVVVRLLPEGGAPLEQAFPWSAVVAPAQSGEE